MEIAMFNAQRLIPGRLRLSPGRLNTRPGRLRLAVMGVGLAMTIAAGITGIRALTATTPVSLATRARTATKPAYLATRARTVTPVSLATRARFGSEAIRAGSVINSIRA
jgi:hypothetical protein